MGEPRPASPFDAHRPALARISERTGGRVAVGVDAHCCHVIVRAQPADEVMRRLSDAAGVPLPGHPNHVSNASGGLADRALSLGPDEWALVGPLERRDGLLRRLEAARGGDHVSVVDVSAARCSLHVHGPAARDMLATGIAIDLDPRAFPPGRCAQTLLGRAAVVLEPIASGGYRITCRPTFAGYVADWLLDAAAEFAVP